jgi:hypothetical protein
MVAVPLFEPLQVTIVTLLMALVNCGGCVIFTEAEEIQPAPSVIVMECNPAGKFETFCVV